MKHTLFILFILLIVISASCQSKDCKELNTNFTSYDEAFNSVRNADFEIEEKINTYKSSWIDKAEYYSCDGQYGYFLLTTSGKTYIHKDLPLSVWKSFKTAKSHGKYYNQNIKGRFKLKI